MKKCNFCRNISFLPVVILMGMLQMVFTAQAQLIVYEPFNYAINLVQPDPDGGVNYNNGLPYTNVDGTPTGTSVGLRPHYGADHKVVAGLSYNNSGGTLLTANNALTRISGTGSSANATTIYKLMTTDPFAAYRSQADAQWFGWNSTSGTKELYFSVLLNASSVNTGTENSFQIGMGFDNVSQTWRIVQSGTDWKFRHHNTTYSTLGAATAGVTAFIVGRLAFTSATSTTIDWWYNPTLGQALGTPIVSNTITTTTSGGQFRQIQTHNGANVLTYDEFRMGVTAADVMPYTPNPSTKLTNVLKDGFKVYQSGKNSISLVTTNGNTQALSRVELYDVKGIRVFQLEKPTQNITINSLSQGMYMVRFSIATESVIRKLIVK